MNRKTLLCAMAMSSVLLAACGGSSKSASTSGAKTPTTPSTTGSGQGESATGTTRPPTATTQATATASAPSGEVSPGVVRASGGAITVAMHASTHHPHVNARWPIAFLATDAGRPAKAEVAYEYLFGGQVVAHRSHYRFTGSFHDTFVWPSTAVGYPLTFRAVITSGGVTIDLDYPVQVVG
jgi:hypothetical protein